MRCSYLSAPLYLESKEHDLVFLVKLLFLMDGRKKVASNLEFQSPDTFGQVQFQSWTTPGEALTFNQYWTNKGPQVSRKYMIKYNLKIEV